MAAVRLPPVSRQVRMLTIGAWCGVVVCVGFVIGYLVAGPRFWLGTALNAVGVIGSALTLVLIARDRARLAVRLFVIMGLSLMVSTSHLLGPAAGFHMWLVAAVPGALLFSIGRDRLMYAAAGVAFVAYLWIEYGVDQADAWIAVDPALLARLHPLSSILAFATLALGVVRFYHDTLAAERRLEVEHARSERLLLNVLPPLISSRLKAGEEPIADRFDDVTVLFADLVGFTALSSRLPPDQLVTLLDQIFTRFDDLSDAHGAEKIKTIGDAYMAAFGLPDPRPDHARAAAELALEMRDAVDAIAREVGLPLSIRIGVASGPVVAGVIGRRKFIYDLWGDTVNLASRMESHGVPGGIQVAPAVHRQLAGQFAFEPRGAVELKGVGPVETFLLVGRATRARTAG